MTTHNHNHFKCNFSVVLAAVFASIATSALSQVSDMKDIFGMRLLGSAEFDNSTATNAVALHPGSVLFRLEPWGRLTPATLENVGQHLATATSRSESFDNEEDALRLYVETGDWFDGCTNLKRREGTVRSDCPSRYWIGTDQNTGLAIAVFLWVEKCIKVNGDACYVVSLSIGELGKMFYRTRPDDSWLDEFKRLDKSNQELLPRLGREMKKQRKAKCVERMRDKAYHGVWGHSSEFDICVFSFDRSGMGLVSIGLGGAFFDWTADGEGNIRCLAKFPNMTMRNVPPEEVVFNLKYDPEKNEMKIASVEAKADENLSKIAAKSKPLPFMSAEVHVMEMFEQYKKNEAEMQRRRRAVEGKRQ